MKNAFRPIIFLVAISLVGFGSTPVFAKGGGHGGGAPSGFSKGEKKGWKGESTPPGSTHGKKKGWGDEKTPPGSTDKKSGGEQEETRKE